MTVPLQLRVIDIDPADPLYFKACTHGHYVDYSLPFLRAHPEYMFQAFVTAHELLHQMADHPALLYAWSRAGSITGHLRNGQPVTRPFDNLAAQHALDYHVNDGAVRMKMPKPPSDIFLHAPLEIGGWLDPEADLYVRVFDKYYDQSAPQPKPTPQSGKGQPQDGDGEDDAGVSGQVTQPSSGKGQPTYKPSSRHPVNDPSFKQSVGHGEFDVFPSDPEDDAGDRNERRRIAMTRAFAPENTDKICGHSPGNVEALINRIYPVKIDWWNFVRPKYMSLTEGTQKSWRVVDPAAFAMGYTMQGRVNPRAGRVAICIDTSGSVNARERSHFISHIRSFADVCMPLELILIELDDAIQRVTFIKEPYQLKRFLDPMERSETGLLGSGGTDMRLFNKWLVDNDRHPDLSLILTDGATPYPTSLGNSKEVFWISTTYREAPAAAGTTVRMFMN